MTAQEDIERFEQIADREAALEEDGVWIILDSPEFAINQVGEHERHIAMVNAFIDSKRGWTRESNRSLAEFIAHARADIPWLMGFSKRLIDQLDVCMATHVKSEEKIGRMARRVRALEDKVLILGTTVNNLRETLRKIAEQAYHDDLVAPGVVDQYIGPEQEYADKEDWIESWISQWAFEDQDQEVV